jgi:hypothetical protein
MVKDVMADSSNAVFVSDDAIAGPVEGQGAAGTKPTHHTDRMAALIAWMLVVRVGELVKDGAKRRSLRRSSILDKFINSNTNAVQAIKAAFSAVGH